MGRRRIVEPVVLAPRAAQGTIQTMIPGAEDQRLEEARVAGVPWKKWGPYLSERQWGTVREDYSTDGNAWDYFSHDQARSRAYRWGEDGIGGFSDDKQRLCFALALWNGNDPILKERMFGLTNAEGNHGEDVKEYYFYLESTPTHSYMKQLYKYPQSAFPYDDLVATNAARGRTDHEYELIDTGVFADDRYFDVLIEYAKAAPDDILIRITATNRADRPASLRILPTLWFRNTWSTDPSPVKPILRRADAPGSVVDAEHATLGAMRWWCDASVPLLFTENETNTERIFGTPNASPYVKDGINDHIVHGAASVNPAQVGTKVAADYAREVLPGASTVVRLRLAPPNAVTGDPFAAFDATFAACVADADAFYAPITAGMDEDHARVTRQALAGMLWSKQCFHFDLDIWLSEHGYDRLNRSNAGPALRNREWFHMLNDDIISMPDKWEYPWYAAWDLAFHTLPLAMVDVDFAKDQLSLILSDLYIHPNGQLPAYEWNFSDVNPPVHAFACKLVYDIDKVKHGKGDIGFLSRSFNKLLLNFTWWVNRKDRFGKNLFEGGFLGLDNIGIFDRSAPLPTGGTLSQADGTAWMAFYALSMLDMAAELTLTDPSFEDMIVKFAEHFVWIALAVLQPSGTKGAMWDEEDGFFYDVLELPDGSTQRLKVRSLVGLLPLCAVMVFDQHALERMPGVFDRIRRRIERLPEIAQLIPFLSQTGVGGSRMLALVDETKLRRVLTRLLDEARFWGPHGVRSISRDHLLHPYVLNVDGHEYKVQYLPAESDTGMFGGNSNWRGPVWMPMNALIVRAFIQFYRFYGDDFTMECPIGSGVQKNLFEIAQELTDRLGAIFLRNAEGKRPVFGGNETFQNDPHWRDNVLFYEYFHGDNGAGLGASHQTGWTGLIAYMLRGRAHLTKEHWLAEGRAALLHE
jgi:hypothetical protein